MSTQKGKPTLTQLQQNALYRATHPDPTGLSDPRKRYADSGRSLMKQATGAEALAYDIFGPEFIGKLAFALDLNSPFFNDTAFGLISYEKRLRQETPRIVDPSWEDTIEVDHYRNYVIDNSFVEYPLYLVSHTSTHISDGAEQPVVDFSYIADSTQKQRGKDSPFGTMEMFRSHWNWSHPYRITSDVYNHRWIDRTKRDYFDLYITRRVRTFKGPVAFVTENPFTRSGSHANGAYASGFASSHLASVLSKTLPRTPLYNPVYQVGELRDLHLMLQKTNEMIEFLQRAASDPKTALQFVDKAFSNAYINKLFGYDSLSQAVRAVLKLPTAAAKKFNFLMSRNGKPTTTRYTQKFPLFVYDSGSRPSVVYHVPDWATVTYDNQWFHELPSLRCVVNQTIQMPSAAVPELSDSNYRSLLGLKLRVKDFYDLIPWTWFVDWFSDLGDYINVVEVIASDPDLIHYGFMTFLLDSQFGHNFGIQVSDQYIETIPGLTVIDPDDTISLEETIRKYDCSTTLWNHFHKRMDISDLFGAKTAYDYQGNLTDAQLKIMGALALAKRP